ncbi:glutamate receptor ionotropic, kainate 5-like isoform 2-T2 [Salvelinus alpinus]
MENIGGIFVVLICGLIIAVFVAIMEFVWSTRCSSETDEVSVCQEMLTEFRNAVSCKKSSRSRRRRPLGNSAALRHPTRIALGAQRPLRLVREMRLSNGKLYSGSGPLTGGAGGPGGGVGAGGGPSDMGPGPQRLLEDPLGANTTPPHPPQPQAAVVLPRSCTHVRICQECRRIQSLRSGMGSTRIPPSSAPLPRLPPPPPPSSSNTDSEGGGGSSPRRLPHSTPAPCLPIPPPQSSTDTDLLGKQD